MKHLYKADVDNESAPQTNHSHSMVSPILREKNHLLQEKGLTNFSLDHHIRGFPIKLEE